MSEACCSGRWRVSDHFSVTPHNSKYFVWGVLSCGFDVTDFPFVAVHLLHYLIDPDYSEAIATRLFLT